MASRFDCINKII